MLLEPGRGSSPRGASLCAELLEEKGLVVRLLVAQELQLLLDASIGFVGQQALVEIVPPLLDEDGQLQRVVHR